MPPFSPMSFSPMALAPLARRPLLLGLGTVLALALLLVPAGVATDDEPPAGLAVDRWLVLGPVTTPLPAFADESPGGVEVGDLLDTPGPSLERPWPAAGDEVAVGPGRTVAWRSLELGGADALTLEADGDAPRTAHLAVYVRADRFAEVEWTVTSAHPVQLFVDGEPVGEKRSSEGEDDEPGEATVTTTLDEGEHLFVVRAVRAPEAADAWTIASRLTVPGEDDHAEENDARDNGEGDAEETGDGDDSGQGDEPTGPTVADLSLDLDPRRPLDLATLLDGEALGSISVSADGELVAVGLSRPAVPADHRNTWVEVRRAEDGELVRRVQGTGSFDWAPTGHLYSWTERGEEGATVWVGDADSGAVRAVLERVEDLAGCRWGAGAESILCGFTTEAEAPVEGLKLMRDLGDRWPGNRDRTHLWRTALEDPDGPGGEPPGPGASQLLAVGPRSVSLLDVSRDGSRALLARQEWIRERPYQATSLELLDLESLEITPLAEESWISSSVRFSPDGSRILLVGGPSGFDGAGRDPDLAEGVILNDYEGEVFLLDPATGAVESPTRDFDPSVNAAAWGPEGRSLFLEVTEGEYSPIYRLDLASGAFERLDLGFEATGTMALSEDGSRLVATGSSAADPPRAVALATGGDADPVLLRRPWPEAWKQIELGPVESFSFTTEDGTEIVGRVHYPPGYDETRRGEYPAIVNYYGGVVPVGRSFGGRYPRSLWAARGYVVYHLQPSGAVGFGQEFAARHVNDWGRRVSGEIIQGTEAFLAAHPAVDPERVGAIGASYGGFMTMLLTTETDLFASAIAHAGISSLSSYWGEGYWGFLYSAVASAESFPWNNPELYIDQSPLFKADRIDTPLLLLHGASDTNVPVGESEQLWVALELLGKEVAFVEVAEADHQVFYYPRRERWTETIVAWFDKYLSEEPEAWNALYPDPSGGEG